MVELVDIYFAAYLCAILLLLLYVVQMVIGDAAQESAGHTPGTPIQGDHDVFVFRAVRAPANSLENIPFMVLLTVLTILLGASPTVTNTLAIAALCVRIAHMLAYYLDKRKLRGRSWLAGILIMLIMCGNGLWALLINWVIS